MRQTFDESTDPSFGPRHVPLIRKAMEAQGLDGFLIPHEDEHQNEYLPEANDRLAWATGFTGSAGAAVIMKDRAAVFVDGRYTLQVGEPLENLNPVFERDQVAVVMDGEKLVGLITKVDLINHLRRSA
jgi:Xaa-Pro aminopeptidase